MFSGGLKNFCPLLFFQEELFQILFLMGVIIPDQILIAIIASDFGFVFQLE